MSRRMTIVFDDEELYTQLKVEAARSHRPAKDLVAEALCLYFGASPGARRSMRPRALATRSAPRANSVDGILQELGLAKEPSGFRRVSASAPP